MALHSQNQINHMKRGESQQETGWIVVSFLFLYDTASFFLRVKQVDLQEQVDLRSALYFSHFEDVVLPSDLAVSVL